MILARYSRFKGALCCIGATIFVIYALLIPFIHAGGATSYFASGDSFTMAYPVVAALAPVSLFFIARLVIALGPGAAIILDEDILRLISGKIVKISKHEVNKVDLQKGGLFPFRFTYLNFHLNGSGTASISTILFDEPAEAVCVRVQAALGL